MSEFKITIESVNDTIKFIKRPDTSIFYKVKDEGIYESAKDKNYLLGHSFLDTLNEYQSLSNWGQVSTLLTGSRTIVVNNTKYKIYRYLESTLDINSTGSISYFSPENGFIFFYLNDDVGTEYRRKPLNNADIIPILIQKIKMDTTFYLESKLKSPKVKIEDYLPPKHSL